jgi:hypothetical protein
MSAFFMTERSRAKYLHVLAVVGAKEVSSLSSDDLKAKASDCGSLHGRVLERHEARGRVVLRHPVSDEQLAHDQHAQGVEEVMRTLGVLK